MTEFGVLVDEEPARGSGSAPKSALLVVGAVVTIVLLATSVTSIQVARQASIRVDELEANVAQLSEAQASNRPVDIQPTPAVSDP